LNPNCGIGSFVGPDGPESITGGAAHAKVAIASTSPSVASATMIARKWTVELR
jgi:hypothetical protein